MGEESKNDGAFEAVLHNTGNIDLFVDEFFSFLARRTDFFVISPPEGGRIGFPPGMAAKLIISKFKKWEAFRNESGAGGTGIGIQQVPASPSSSVPVPEPSTCVEVKTEECDSKSSERKEETLKKIPTGPTPPLKSDKKKKDSNLLWDDSYNGRKTDKYTWSQSIKELDVHIAVGKDVKSKRDLQVKILADRLCVTVPAQENPVVADWKLSNPIVKDESYWSLHPGEAVFFSLQKVREMWWDRLFEGEEAIDRNKIDAVKPMEDLDEEEQAKIHELVYNQEQKLKGLPTTDQMKLDKIMKEAWNAKGSPFQGEPYDPTRVQLASNVINENP